MEMNKDEAVKCKEIAKKFLKSGQFEKAIRFFEKSDRLYPLPGVKEMIQRAQKELKKPTASSAPSAASAPPASTSSSSTTSRPYTPEQVKIVNHIKSCKTHYEVLSISSTADENDIKKAYRKLALKLHPDKNSAPGAEDAFKAVGKAFAVLNDADKRAYYDKYGEDHPSEGGGSSTRRRNYTEEEVSPEDIFNMFFGGQIPRRNNMYRRAPNHRQQNHVNPGGLQQFLQFIPLVVILFLSFFSVPSEKQQPFSMHPTAQYHISRTTRARNVVSGIPYFVDNQFASRYGRSWRDLMQIEQAVEQSHVRNLEENCRSQKSKQKRMIYQARNVYGKDAREKAMRKALHVKMPACKELKKIRRFQY